MVVERGGLVRHSKNRVLDFRFGSKADIGEGATDVRLTPKSGHWKSTVQCPLCAKSRHQPPSFDHLIGDGE
jgi:hypothetical protein